jgi:hypothetical protein
VVIVLLASNDAVDGEPQILFLCDITEFTDEAIDQGCAFRVCALQIVPILYQEFLSSAYVQGIFLQRPPGRTIRRAGRRRAAAQLLVDALLGS